MEVNCKMFHFDIGNGTLDNDTTMDLKKSLLLSFVYLHAFVSKLAFSTPKPPECVCFEQNFLLSKVPQILDPGNKGTDRLVIYVYKTQNGFIHTYIPNLIKQKLLPDLQYEYGDILDVVDAKEPLETIFLNSIYNVDKNRVLGQDSAISQDNELVHARPEDALEDDEVNKTDDNNLNILDKLKLLRKTTHKSRRIEPDISPIANKIKSHPKGAKHPIIYLQTDSLKKMSPLINLSESDTPEDIHPEIFNQININRLQPIPEVLDEESDLLLQRPQYISDARRPIASNYFSDRHTSLPFLTKKTPNLFHQNSHFNNKPITPVVPNNLFAKVYNKNGPIDLSKKESDLVNLFLIDMIENGWRTNFREPFNPISSNPRMPDVTFDKWFVGEMESIDLGKSNKQPIDFKTLQQLVQAALKRHGLVVSSKGVLRDSHGNILNMKKLHLRRLFIGDSLEYYKVKANPDGTFKLPKNSSYMESLMIALWYPLKIIGIIPLGRVNLPKNFDFNYMRRQNDIQQDKISSSKNYQSLDKASVEIVEPKNNIEPVLEVSHIDINDNAGTILNKLDITNSENELRIGEHDKERLSKKKAKGSEDIPTQNLSHTVMEILNDSVPISKSASPVNRPRHVPDEISEINAKKDLSKVESHIEVNEKDSSEHSELPLQTIVALLQKFVDEHKNEKSSAKMRKQKLLEELGISRRKNKSEVPRVPDPLVTTDQKHRKGKPLLNETKANNTLAQFLGPVIEKIKTHVGHIPRGLNNIKTSFIGESEIADDHDFRIIGGAAATGSGLPISNRGRSADKS